MIQNECKSLVLRQEEEVRLRSREDGEASRNGASYARRLLRLWLSTFYHSRIDGATTVPLSVECIEHNYESGGFCSNGFRLKLTRDSNAPKCVLFEFRI